MRRRASGCSLRPVRRLLVASRGAGPRRRPMWMGAVSMVARVRSIVFTGLGVRRRRAVPVGRAGPWCGRGAVAASRVRSGREPNAQGHRDPSGFSSCSRSRCPLRSLQPPDVRGRGTPGSTALGRGGPGVTIGIGGFLTARWEPEACRALTAFAATSGAATGSRDGARSLPFRPSLLRRAGADRAT